MRWTRRELDLLRRRYHWQRTESLARRLGRTKHAVDVKASKMGLRKSPEYMEKRRSLGWFANFAAAGHFKRGNLPKNKRRRVFSISAPVITAQARKVKGYAWGGSKP